MLCMQKPDLVILILSKRLCGKQGVQEKKLRKYIMKLWKPLCTVCSIGLIYPVLAANPCYLDTKTQTTLLGTIDQIRNPQYSTKESFDGHRKCVVGLDVLIRGQWYSTSGSYTFGPDISQNEACEKALHKAKTEAVRMVVPQTLVDKANMVCDENPNAKIGKEGKYVIIDTLYALPWTQPRFLTE